MGPDRLPPNWFWRNLGLWLRVVVRAKKFLASVMSLRKNSYAEPWTWFAPDFVMTLMAAPPVRPTSAL